MSTVFSRGGIVAAVFAVMVLAAPSTSQAQLYDFTDLGAVYGKHSYAAAIGNGGAITGVSGNDFNSDAHGFAFFGGPLFDLGTFGGKQTYGSAVTSTGTIVGGSNLPTGRPHAFLYRLGPGISDLGVLPGGDTSWAYAVNDKLMIGGTSNTASGRYHAVVWNPSNNGTQITDLDPLGMSSQVNGLNANGDAAGFWLDPLGRTHAVIWSGGLRMDLGNLGVPFAYAWGINSKKQVVGVANVSNFGTSFISQAAFIWDPKNGMKQVTSLSGGTDCALYSINNKGDAVGFSQDFAQDNHAVIYHNGSLTDLNEFVDPSLQWTLTVADGINDAGEIVGEAQQGSVKRAFKLTPIAVHTLDLLPGIVLGGGIVHAVISLNAPAPKDLAVAMSSNSNAAAVPALVAFTKGTQIAHVKIKTKPVLSKLAVTITASYGASSVNGKLVIVP